MRLISLLVALTGFYFAYVLYYKKPGTAAELASRAKPAYTVLANKYWVDEFYSNFLVIPLMMFSRGVLDFIVDRGLVNGSGRAAGFVTRGFAWATRSQISGQHSFVCRLAGYRCSRSSGRNDLRPIAAGAPVRKR